MKNTELFKQAQERVKEYERLQEEGLINLKGEFFPSVCYPPITMYPPISEEALFEGYRNPSDNLFVIYVHIPFCKRICNFCHFVVSSGASSAEKDDYLTMLEKEMDIYMRRLGLKIIKARSMLVAGGTPTFLTPVQLKRFLSSFISRLDLTLSSQFSYDIEPTTIIGPQGSERLRIMKDYGVDRLTIGIQAFDDEILKRMNRSHTAEDAMKSIKAAQQAGFKVNIEFIYGYPEFSLEKWRETMETAVSLGTDEIQLYRLKIIPYGGRTGFILGQYKKRPEKFPELTEVLMMKEIANLILKKNGYHENLRRVFVKDLRNYSHYSADVFWRLKDQIGLGLGAFSSLRDRYILGAREFKDYYALIQQGKMPIDRGLVRDRDDQLRWSLILPLKSREAYKKLYEQQTGVSLNNVFREKIERLKAFGLLYEDEKVLRLTMSGDFFADEVCQQFYHPKYLPFPKSSYASGVLNPYNENATL